MMKRSIACSLFFIVVSVFYAKAGGIYNVKNYGAKANAPAYGFFMRHAKNIKMTEIDLNLINPDDRPAFKASDVKGLILHQVSATKIISGRLAVLNDVSGLKVIESLDIKNQ